MASVKEKYTYLREELRPEQQPNLQRCKDGQLGIKEFCMACDKATGAMHQHPLFAGSACVACYGDMVRYGFSCEKGDGSTKYCVVCTNSGKMAVCENRPCRRSFCFGCVRDLGGEGPYLEIQEEDGTWECFLCLPWSRRTHGLLRPRPPHERLRHLLEMVFPDKVTPAQQMLSQKKLRVLSLFDGIGAGLVALKELGLEIEVYFASEIDPSSISVTETHHPEVIHIGDVRKITPAVLQAIGPIDLLIGGSPCNDLSIANPKRKGLLGQSRGRNLHTARRTGPFSRPTGFGTNKSTLSGGSGTTQPNAYSHHWRNRHSPADDSSRTSSPRSPSPGWATMGSRGRWQRHQWSSSTSVRRCRGITDPIIIEDDSMDVIDLDSGNDESGDDDCRVIITDDELASNTRRHGKRGLRIKHRGHVASSWAERSRARGLDHGDRQINDLPDLLRAASMSHNPHTPKTAHLPPPPVMTQTEHAGTGILFFEYFRVKAALEFLFPQTCLFFLYENVKSMREEDKQTITRFFDVEPALWDAIEFSPMRRQRYFWGNIPGLSKDSSRDASDRQIEMADVLMPNRFAAVTHLPTITTNRFSMLSGPEQAFPVLHRRGGADNLWMTEVEGLFGFPRHYTDVGNLSATKRQGLLGQSWSVHVVMHIMLSLRFFFKMSEKHDT